jgi:hypothetical protein
VAVLAEKPLVEQRVVVEEQVVVFLIQPLTYLLEL